jgi:hypothetical protein
MFRLRACAASEVETSVFCDSVICAKSGVLKLPGGDVKVCCYKKADKKITRTKESFHIQM